MTSSPDKVLSYSDGTRSDITGVVNEITAEFHFEPGNCEYYNRFIDAINFTQAVPPHHPSLFMKGTDVSAFQIHTRNRRGEHAVFCYTRQNR